MARSLHAPYHVIPISARKSCIHHSRQAVGRLLFKRSRCFAYAAQNILIIRFISTPWFFSLMMYSVVPIYLTFDILYQHIAHVVWDAVYTTSHMYLQCSSYICCNSYGVSVNERIMSSAKRRLMRYSPSIFTPYFYQFNLIIKCSPVLP